MAAPRRHFRIESRFGPRELLLALKEIAEDRRVKAARPEFEFDWLARRVALSATKREVARDLAERLVERVEKRAGPGLLLPAEPVVRDGRHVHAFGVLIQTPDVYTEHIAAALAESGVAGVRVDGDCDGFSVPAATMMEREDLMANFPLPGYLKVVEVEAP